MITDRLFLQRVFCCDIIQSDYCSDTGEPTMRRFRADLQADPDKAKAELLRRFSEKAKGRKIVLFIGNALFIYWFPPVVLRRYESKGGGWRPFFESWSFIGRVSGKDGLPRVSGISFYSVLFRVLFLALCFFGSLDGVPFDAVTTAAINFGALVIMTILAVCEREDEEALNRSAVAIIEG